jgi:hypothetical protein
MKSGLFDSIQLPRVISVLVASLSVAGASRAQAQCPGHWVPEFGVGISGNVYALEVLPGGNLVAGGNFAVAGSVGTSYVATWDGTSWSRMASPGFGNPVLALAVLGNGDLIAGGSLLIINTGTGAGDFIARWNGASWSPLGQGVNNIVRALSLGPDGQLLVGGMFDSAGGQDAFSIASWSSVNWSTLGTGTEHNGGDSGYVFAIATMHNGDIVAGGAFAVAGGIQTGPIARWDGASWSALDTGVIGITGPGTVYALAVLPNGDLVAGGSFATAGTVPASNIARWDGANWSALGAGVSGGSGTTSVNALAVMPDGDLIVGGSFTSAGDVSANGIARWDGTAWSTLGTVTSFVRALAVMPNGDLVAGGWFTMASGAPAVNLARWTTACNPYCDADFNHDGDSGTDADIEAFFACIAGSCCATCGSADFNGDGDAATDADIEAFFRVLGGGPC